MYREKIISRHNTEYMVELLKKRVEIDYIVSALTPEKLLCRKPETGLLEEIENKLNQTTG